MKNLALLLILILGFYSCDKCRYVDCAGDDFFGQFRIISKTDSSDLVFGSKKIYDKNQIKFYSVKSSDTTFFDYKTIMFGGNNYDSILYVYFYPQTSTPVYIKLSDTDTDTLTMIFQTTTSSCCGTHTSIDNFYYNLMKIPGSQGTQAILK